ncbi:uracil phosphoribosyltransferase [bacterium]|nr:uracil phosphoribosyltransferase [bacterium]
MEPVILENEPSVAHLLSILRDRTTTTSEYVARTDTLASLVVATALRSAPFKEIEIETPLETAKVRRISEKEVIAVPILRAGLGMERAFLRLLPGASIYHIGMRRDETTFRPHYYYDSFPVDLSDKTVFMLDPMLATGGSAVSAAKKLIELKPNKVVYCGIIGAPDGMNKLRTTFPQIDIYLAALDKRLDENAYIRPGLGDAGDRYYGTL